MDASLAKSTLHSLLLPRRNLDETSAVKRIIVSAVERTDVHRNLQTAVRRCDCTDLRDMCVFLLELPG